MMHHNTKFGNKMFGGLEAIFWTNINILTLYCDLDPEWIIQSFSQDTLVYDEISSEQVWLPRNQQFRKYSRKTHSFIISALAVTLTLKIAPKKCFFHKTLWLMMLHHHTNFGIKMFCELENIVQTNIHRHFEPSPWPWPFFHRTLQLMMLYYQTKFECKPTSSLEDTIEIVIFDHKSPCCDLNNEHSEPLFLHDILTRCCITIPGLVTNVLWFRRYGPDKHSLTFWTFGVSLTFNAVIPFFHRTLAYNGVLSYQVWL